MRRRALLLAPVVAVLAACGLDHGTVTAKHDQPAYTTTDFFCQPIGGNPCGWLLPMPRYVPECWSLELRDGDDTGSVCVDQGTYQRVALGQRYGGTQ